MNNIQSQQKKKSGKGKDRIVIGAVIVVVLGLSLLWFQLLQGMFDDEMRPAVITLKGDTEITLVKGNDYEEPGFEVSDPRLTEKVAAEGRVDVHTPGTYELKYSIPARPGKTVFAVRKVNVVNRSPDAQVPIFMYHEVADDTWGNEGLFVKVSDFEEQMKYLSENGYQSLFMHEVKNQPDYHKKVVITFDDAYVGFYDNVLPILKQYNIKATLYVITTAFDGRYVSQEQLKEIHNSGLVQIGSHTRTHPDLTVISREELDAELRESQEFLENLLQTKVTTFAYPLGRVNPDVMDAAKRYYRDALITGGALAAIGEHTEFFMLPRYAVYRTSAMKYYTDCCSKGR